MDEPAASVPPPAKTGPRFPWPAALLCAASLGAAAWTWMRYSYAWKVTSEDLVSAPWGLEQKLSTHPYYSRYVALRGVFRTTGYHGSTEDGWWTVGAVDGPAEVAVWPIAFEPLPRTGDAVLVKGRVQMCYAWNELVFLVTEPFGRFHGASITGLVVGAMGLVVFAVYLRMWVKGRRAEKKGASDGQG